MKEIIKRISFASIGIVFFSIFFVPLLLSEKKRGPKRVKDYFVPDSHLFNWWIGAYSESELWGVLPDHFYQL